MRTHYFNILCDKIGSTFKGFLRYIKTWWLLSKDTGAIECELNFSHVMSFLIEKTIDGLAYSYLGIW